jgi:hypothetical protein
VTAVQCPTDGGTPLLERISVLRDKLEEGNVSLGQVYQLAAAKRMRQPGTNTLTLGVGGKPGALQPLEPEASLPSRDSSPVKLGELWTWVQGVKASGLH